jgi:hypothetical protein
MGAVTSVDARYNKEMFSTPSPEHVKQPSQHSILTQLLDSPNKETVAKVNVEMSASLSPLNEPAGKAIGFFEQGLLTGGAVAVVSALTALLLTARYVGPAIMERVM